MVEPILQGLAAERLATGDYNAYLLYFGSEARWGPLVRLYRSDLCKDSLAILFHDVWIMARNLPPAATLNYLISAMGECPKTFSEADQAVFDALQPEFMVYRGFRGPNRKSRSWTPSDAKARNFAANIHHGLNPHGQPQDRSGVARVTVRTITKSDVLFYTNERKEQEIVLRVSTAGF